MARKRYQKGSLFERNGNWVGRWREDVIEDGELKRVYRNAVLGSRAEFPTKRLAQRELDARLAHINRPDYQATPNATFGDFHAKWERIVLPQIKPSSQLTLKAQLRQRLLPAFSDVLLKDFSPQLLQSYINLWSKTFSYNTVKGAIMVLRTLWKTARVWKYVNFDPFEGLVFPARGLSEQRCFSLEETQRIIAAAKEPYKTFFWLAAETGMRAGELIGLRRCDVDVDAGVVFVRQAIWRGKPQLPKTKNAQRGIAVSPALREHLLKFLSGEGPASVQLLFRTRNERPWDYTGVLKDKLKPLLKKLRIPDAGFHAFRHGNATMLCQIGTDPKTVQHRLGHSDISTTMRVYAHRLGAADFAAAAQFGHVLHPVAPTGEAVGV